MVQESAWKVLSRLEQPSHNWEIFDVVAILPRKPLKLHI